MKEERKVSQAADHEGGDNPRPASNWLLLWGLGQQFLDYTKCPQAKMCPGPHCGHVTILSSVPVFSINSTPFFLALAVLALWQLVSIGPKLRGMSYKPKSQCLLRGFMH